jgi:hypothetical protein
MAGLIKYEITNKGQLRAHTQEVANKTAIKLGFTTAKKSLTIKIGFKKGASHKSWNSGSLVESQQLAQWLVSGFKAGRAHKRIRGRPVFDQYLTFHKDEIKNICTNAFKGSGSIQTKALRAGNKIKEDLKRRIYQGSFYLAANGGQYAIKKIMKGYGDIPLVATKALFEDLEVVVDYGG